MMEVLAVPAPPTNRDACDQIIDLGNSLKLETDFQSLSQHKDSLMVSITEEVSRLHDIS